mgnify:CR=1 FL=1
MIKITQNSKKGNTITKEKNKMIGKEYLGEMNNRKIYLSTRQCGKTKMLIGFLKEVQKHLNNKDDFINFVEKLDKDLANKIHKEQERVNE